jgi:pantoate--beta-alanine ligase
VRLIERAAELRAWTAAYRSAGLSVGFVPTLGALHEGHFSLMRQARQECDRVVVSIYLNPTQFNSASDLEKYPSTPESDLEGSRREGADLLYLGRGDDLLPPGFQSWVEVTELTRPLCGPFRAGHFRGVTTVVAQLLHLVEPHRAYFGLKDFQQAAVLDRMVADLWFPAEVRRLPTVREADGLAMSSRNARLSPQEREAAPAIHRALGATRRLMLGGESRVARLAAFLLDRLREEPRLRVEYAEILDAGTLAPFASGSVRPAPHGILIAVAAHAGGVRLIDNVWVEPGGGLQARA